MIYVTLRDKMTGSVVAQVLSPALPTGDEIVLKRRDPDGGDPVEELFYIEDFVGWVFSEGADGVFSAESVDVVVSRARLTMFDGGGADI